MSGESDQFWSLSFVFLTASGEDTLQRYLLGGSADGLKAESTLEYVKTLLGQHFILPPWRTSLSYKGRSLDGQSRLTLGEIGISNNAELGLQVFSSADQQCETHSQLCKDRLCTECLQFFCVECAIDHLQETTHKRMLKLEAGSEEKEEDEKPKEELCDFLGQRFANENSIQWENRKQTLDRRLVEIETKIESLRQESLLLGEERSALVNALAMQNQWMSESLPFLLAELRKLNPQNTHLLQPTRVCAACAKKKNAVQLSTVVLRSEACEVCEECYAELADPSVQLSQLLTTAERISRRKTHDTTTELNAARPLLVKEFLIDGLLLPDLERLAELIGHGLDLSSVRWIRVQWRNSTDPSEDECRALLLILKSASTCEGLDLQGSRIPHCWFRRFIGGKAYSSQPIRWLNLRNAMGIGDNCVEDLKRQSFLETLNLSFCSQLGDLGLRELCAALPSLRSLNLTACGSISDAGFKELAKLGPTLRYLNLYGCHQLSDVGLGALNTTLPALEALNLTACTRLTDTSIKELIKLPNLRSLSLSGCKQITDASIIAIAKLPCLTSLNLAGCSEVSDAGVREIGKASGLRIVSLASCPRITNLALAELVKLPRLENLNVLGCTSLKDVRGLCASKSLRVLNLSRCSFIDPSTISELSKCSTLQTLILKSSAVSDETIDEICKLPSLETLNLEECSQLSLDCVAALAGASSLRHVVLSGCPGVTNVWLAVLSQYRSSLESLRLNGCSNLTDVCIDYLLAMPNLKHVEVSSDRISAVALKRIQHLQYHFSDQGSTF